MPSPPGLSDTLAWLRSVEAEGPDALGGRRDEVVAVVRRLVERIEAMDALLLECGHVTLTNTEAQGVATQVLDALHMAESFGEPNAEEKYQAQVALYRKLERLAEAPSARHLVTRIRSMVDTGS